MIHVSLVERHDIQRLGLASLLDSAPGINVLATSRYVPSGTFEGVDVLLLSYCATCDLPPAGDILEWAHKVRTVVFSGKATPVSLWAYEETGAQALIHQSDSIQSLFDSIRRDKSDSQNSPKKSARSQMGLSRREALVLTEVGEGYTNTQIARRIGISEHTVDTYIRRIRSKLRLGNKAQLARAAVQLSGILASDPQNANAPQVGRHASASAALVYPQDAG